jgi:hypothetical protein
LCVTGQCVVGTLTHSRSRESQVQGDMAEPIRQLPHRAKKRYRF